MTTAVTKTERQTAAVASGPTELSVRAALRLGIYLILCLAPLMFLALGVMPTRRGFWIEFGAALGMIGFGMLVMQCFTTARFPWVAPGLGTDTELLFHRRAGIFAFFVVMAHPLTLLVNEPTYLEYFDPRVNLLRALFLSAATIGLVLLVVLPLWRLSFGLSYEWWRITHGLITVGVLLVAVVHAIQVGHYTNTFWKQAAWAAFGSAGMLLVIYTRVVKPLTIAARPYRVAGVRDERGEVYSLLLQANGHAGLTFIAGQYAWLTIGDTPFTLQQHPFTIASSDKEAERIEFAIKNLGDFTKTIKDIPPDTRAYVEGPFGTFTLPPDSTVGGFFVAGGIGITPFLSMLRSCRDRNDRRSLVLLYANDHWDEVAFRDELEELQTTLNLNLVHVLNETPEDWHGESGYVTPEMIGRYLSKTSANDFHCYTCGPEPLMDAAVKGFTASGVPLWRQESERFQIV